MTSSSKDQDRMKARKGSGRGGWSHISLHSPKDAKAGKDLNSKNTLRPGSTVETEPMIKQLESRGELFLAHSLSLTLGKSTPLIRTADWISKDASNSNSHICFFGKTGQLGWGLGHRSETTEKQFQVIPHHEIICSFCWKGPEGWPNITSHLLQESPLQQPWQPLWIISEIRNLLSHKAVWFLTV